MHKHRTIMTVLGVCVAIQTVAARFADADPVRCYFPIPVESELSNDTPDVLTKAIFAVSLDLFTTPVTSKNAEERAKGDDGLALCSKALQAVVERDWDAYRSTVCTDLPLVKGQGYLYDEYDFFFKKDNDYAIHARTSVGEYPSYVVDMTDNKGVRRPWFFPVRSSPSFCYDGQFEVTLTPMDWFLRRNIGDCPPFLKSMAMALPFDASNAMTVHIPVPAPKEAGYEPPTVILEIHPYGKMGAIKELTDQTLAAFTALVPKLPILATKENADELKRYRDSLRTVMMPLTYDYFSGANDPPEQRKDAEGLYKLFAEELPSLLKNMDGAMMVCADPDYILIPDFVAHPVDKKYVLTGIYKSIGIMQHQYDAPFPYWHFRLHEGKMYINGLWNNNLTAVLSWPAFWDQMRARFEKAHGK